MTPTLPSEEAMWLRALFERPTDSVPTGIAERLLELGLIGGLPVPGGFEITATGRRWLAYDRRQQRPSVVKEGPQLSDEEVHSLRMSVLADAPIPPHLVVGLLRHRFVSRSGFAEYVVNQAGVDWLAENGLLEDN